MRLTGRMDITDFLAAAVLRNLRRHAAHVAMRRRRCNALHASCVVGAGFKPASTQAPLFTRRGGALPRPLRHPPLRIAGATRCVAPTEVLCCGGLENRPEPAGS